MKVCVVIATYNEAENVKRLLPEILGLELRPSIVVVDDNSPDGTAGVVKSIAGQGGEGRVTLLERPGKMGYGSAFVLGFQQALASGAEVIVSMDADYSHDPRSIGALVGLLDHCDLAIGSRYVGGIRILNWSMRRLLLSYFANHYVNFILGFKVLDCTSGFRAYRAGLLRTVNFKQVSSQGYAFIVEMLEHAAATGHRVLEAPIVYTERQAGRSKMSRGVILEAIRRPWSIRLKRLLGRGQ